MARSRLEVSLSLLEACVEPVCIMEVMRQGGIWSQQKEMIWALIEGGLIRKTPAEKDERHIAFVYECTERGQRVLDHWSSVRAAIKLN